jgi:hypothetical protein
LSTQHTPGPWIAKRHGVIVGGVLRQYANGAAQDQLFMANAVQDDNGGDGAQAANTLLVAAAPEMLAELCRLLDREHNPYEPDNQSATYYRIKALIAKATGGQA